MTTHDLRPDVRSSAAIEPLAASSPPAHVAAPINPPRTDLESRIRERRGQLIDRLGQLRGDVRPEATESRERLKAKLSELKHIVSWGVVDDGWASLGSPLTNKLEQWLAESARQLATRNEQP